MEAKRIRNLAPRYKMIDGTIYKIGFSTSYLSCIAKPETITILRQVHEGYTVMKGQGPLFEKSLTKGNTDPQ